MPKTQPQLNVRQLQKAIDRLSVADRVQLTQAILKKTWFARFESLLKRIQQKTGRVSLSPAAVRKVCEEARRELYETRYRYQHSR